MKIAELERIFRQAMQANPGRSPLSLLADGGHLSTELPEEFAAAALNVAGRKPESAKGGPPNPTKRHGWA